MNVALAAIFVVVGLLWAVCPQWFCKKVTPEQQARDRKRFMTFGAIILALGLVLLGIQALK
jgi:uncharacterized protein YjeT (DUF2065 family)